MGAFDQFGVAQKGSLVQEFTEAEIERSQLGLSLAPVPINAEFGKTRVLIGLGSYLVNAADAIGQGAALLLKLEPPSAKAV